MSTHLKTPAGPTELSFYTTWWLTPTPSISSSNAASSSADDSLLIEKDRKKQVKIDVYSNSEMTQFDFSRLEND